MKYSKCNIILAVI
uniref:Uncharacterized protein n=1 Tax=Arundo donax TaxID=35708 RepID=A0A0A8Z878_ARUDO